MNTILLILAILLSIFALWFGGWFAQLRQHWRRYGDEKLDRSDVIAHLDSYSTADLERLAANIDTGDEMPGVSFIEEHPVVTDRLAFITFLREQDAAARAS